MAVTIPTAYLNRTCTITRPASPSTVDAHGVLGADTTVSAVAKVRIYQNKDFGSRVQAVEEQGIVAASSHKGVVGPSEGVMAGDTIKDNSTNEKFKVNLVDSAPAGHIGSHKELWLSSSEYL